MNDDRLDNLEQAVTTALGPESPLTEELPGFAPRRGQVDMALAVARTLRQQVPLVVEAGTGTGKTLAYLIPAVAAGLKTIISTGTKTLQDQVNAKELPLLAKTMAPGLRWAVLKGRSNYLCLRRYRSFTSQPDLGLPGAVSALATLKRWLAEGGGGDLDEVRGRGLDRAVLPEITSNSEQCLGGRCEFRNECHLTEARRKAAEADVVVVNHHLFLADLRLKAEGHGEALPRYQAVVFDEAHMLPDVATAIFGVTASEARLRQLLADIARGLAADPSVSGAAMSCEQAGKQFFGELGNVLKRNGHGGLSQAQLEGLKDHSGAMAAALDELADCLAEASGDEAEALSARAAALSMDLHAACDPAPGHTVAWIERRGRGLSLNLSPVDVGPHLDHALYQENGRLVFTSATMAAGDDLAPMARRLGLPTETRKQVVASPFDPASQALLYVPKNMPQPNSPGFAKAVADQVEMLLTHSRGRAFILFTSHRVLDAVSRLLAGKLTYPCLIQGQAPRLKLIERFMAEPSVLFATASFWQGVDVPGEALSAVIIDKLPFSPPDDPLVAARMARLESEGMSGFAHLMVPEAILSLKQGLGRLLRTPEDRGLLAVLDNRIITKPYGRRFIKALQPVPLTSDPGDVEAFFLAT